MKYIIKQTIVLQVVKCVDIGQSAYAQLQNMLKVDTENVSVSADTETGGSNQFKAAWEPKQSRMLKFSLTDGFHEIGAIGMYAVHQYLKTSIYLRTHDHKSLFAY